MKPESSFFSESACMHLVNLYKTFIVSVLQFRNYIKGPNKIAAMEGERWREREEKCEKSQRYSC